MRRITIFYGYVIIVFLVVSFNWGPLQAAIPAEERAALIACYNSSDGNHWLNNSGWKTPPLHTDGFALPGTEGNWYGITVIGNHVTKISLSNNLLSGSIPAELGNLSYLWGLLLDYNQLSGNIPAELGDISRLVTLSLNNNQLSGRIPPELGNLGNMENLDLSWNQLTGSIPPELGGICDIWSLFLNNNKLSGEIPYFFYIHAFLSLDIGYNCLYSTDPDIRFWLNSHDPDWELHQDRCESAGFRLNRSQLYFSSTTGGTGTAGQNVRIDKMTAGTLNWTGTVDTAWLGVSPVSGAGPGVITVSVNAANLEPGDYTGTITVASTGSEDISSVASVYLKVYPDGETQDPFGDFATPADGAAVSGSIPVTGWALDDIDILKVEIFSGEIYVGDAVFVEGARPDVELANPGYPRNYRAGWGYMLLTHFLPGGANGTYTLSARAMDAEGHYVTLGTKTIAIDNAHAVKPFGAVDTPGQGGTASGSAFTNWGWVLTPLPNAVPTTGQTIAVYVDGVNVGHPVYNIYNSDVAFYFPGYANSGGAAGRFSFDTTAYANGIHTIYWVAEDDAGNSDGIGSRYFSIENFGNSNSQAERQSFSLSPEYYTPDQLTYIPLKETGPVQVTRGIGKDRETREILTDSSGAAGVNLKELEPLEIHLGENIADLQGYMVVGGQRRDLPVGSTLDIKTGKFFWLPGPGFIGTYGLVFVIAESGGRCYQRKIEISISAKY